MASRTATDYLERKRIYQPRTLHCSRFATGAQHSHKRPIVHHPDTLGPDAVVDRVVTQEERKRVPYLGTCIT